MDGVGPGVVKRRHFHIIGARTHAHLDAEVGSLAAVVVGRQHRSVAVGEAAYGVRVTSRVDRQRARLRRLDAENVEVVRVVQPPLPRSAQGEIGRVRARVAVVVAIGRHGAGVVVARAYGDVEVGAGTAPAPVAPLLQISIAAPGGDAKLAGVHVPMTTLALESSAVEREEYNRVGTFVHGNNVALPAVEQFALENDRVVQGDPRLVAVLAFVVAYTNFDLGRALTGDADVDVVYRIDVHLFPKAQPPQHFGQLAFHQARRREVAQVPVGQLQQAHHFNGLVRRHIEPPLALAIAQRPRALGLSRARLQLGRRERQRAARFQRDAHRSGPLPPVVQRVDGHAGGDAAGIDHPQLGLLVEIAARVERGDVVRGVRDERDVMHWRYETRPAAHKGKRFNHQAAVAAVDGEPPIAAPRADAARQPLVRVALLQVVRVEVDDAVRRHRDRYRRRAVARVVHGPHLHRPARVRVVDDAREALLQRVGRSLEQRDVVRFGEDGRGEDRQTAEHGG